MKNNKVLVFSTDDHLYPAGGAEQAFGNISERLPQIEFHMICAKLRKSALSYEKIKNVHIYRMGFGIPKLDGFILALFGHVYAYKLMRQYTFDLVWSIMASYGAFSVVRMRKKIDIPFVLTLQEGDSFEYIYSRVKFVRGKFNEIFKSATAVQAISHYLLEWGYEMGYKGKLGKVIPNGVAIDAFMHEYSQDEVKTCRDSFGFKKDAFVLVTSSRLEKKNGIIDVINALVFLPEHVCFVVCGSGSLQLEIQKRVQELNLEHRVLFKGFVDPKELPLIMKASDAFIRPSLTEGLGNAFLEAMAAEILVIGTRAGGIPDFLSHGVTGFFVEIQNPKSIAEIVITVMSLSLDHKKEILSRSRKMVEDTYNWEVIVKDIEQLFNEVCKS